MLVDLDIKILESIFRDGVQDMLKNVGGRNAGANRKGWFKTVRESIKEYQHQIKEDFLPVLVKDFSEKNVVKFSKGQMDEEEINKIKMFMVMLKKSNTLTMKE